MPAAGSSLHASAAWRVLDGFGGSRRALSRSVSPRDAAELARVFAAARDEGFAISFRGSGRSYGDASLAEGQLSLDMRGMNRVLAWDPASAIADVEPGVTIGDLWRRTLPDGGWPMVVPGTMFPTVGGCVAMNIHGKNCFKVGPFGDHVLELDLMSADGALRTLSREREPELFHAVIAGLGLLGAVTRVRLRLKHVESGELVVRPIRAPSFAAMFDAFLEHMPASDYLVGWVDAFATGPALGRGLVHRANYLTAEQDPHASQTLAIAHQDLPATIAGVPKSLLWMLLRPFTNDTGMRLVNAVKYAIPEPVGRDGTYRDSHAGFAFLLDYVPGWRRAYGPGGFLQYQLFVPDAAARTAFPDALARLQRLGVVPYLGVFKRHRPDAFLMSHGLDGWSLALDFKVPDRRDAFDRAMRELTALVLDAGGTFYPAKDQVVDAASFARAFGDRLTRFREIRRRLDPDRLFTSDLAKRLEIV